MRRRTDRLFRRNLLVAGVCHAALIIGVFVFERVQTRSADELVTVELFTPADILGDMPKGAGYGRGAYAPVAGGEDAAPPPAAPPAAATLAPAPPAAPAAAPEAGEVYVPKPAAPKPAAPAVTKPAPAPTAKNTTKPSTTKSASKSTSSKPKSGGSSTGAGPERSGPVAKGPSMKDIRNRFASALQATEGGTPYGDGRAPGGGDGSSEVIGSRNGSPDGIVGGVGQGSPFWSYYQHVHDKMYEAWNQPGAAVNWDRSLVTTIKLVVARDGSILQVKVVGRSGNPIMDESAETAARRVSQLKPLPDGLGGTTAPITVNFRLEG